MNYLKVAILLLGIAMLGGGIFSISKRNVSLFSYTELYAQYSIIILGILLLAISESLKLDDLMEGIDENKETTETTESITNSFEENHPMQSLEPEHSRAEMVLYYASWCGHSKAFLDPWRKFVEKAKKDFPDLKLTEIRCEGDNQNFCNEVGVEGYPTVVLYIDDKQYMFNDERTVEKLKAFVADKI